MSNDESADDASGRHGSRTAYDTEGYAVPVPQHMRSSVLSGVSSNGYADPEDAAASPLSPPLPQRTTTTPPESFGGTAAAEGGAAVASAVESEVDYAKALPSVFAKTPGYAQARDAAVLAADSPSSNGSNAYREVSNRISEIGSDGYAHIITPTADYSKMKDLPYEDAAASDAHVAPDSTDDATGMHSRSGTYEQPTIVVQRRSRRRTGPRGPRALSVYDGLEDTDNDDDDDDDDTNANDHISAGATACDMLAPLPPLVKLSGTSADNAMLHDDKQDMDPVATSAAGTTSIPAYNKTAPAADQQSRGAGRGTQPADAIDTDVYPLARRAPATGARAARLQRPVSIFNDDDNMATEAERGVVGANGVSKRVLNDDAALHNVCISTIAAQVPVAANTTVREGAADTAPAGGSRPAPLSAHRTRRTSRSRRSSDGPPPATTGRGVGAAAGAGKQTVSAFTSDTLASTPLEKSGYLQRQTGKLKLWRRRWCVLNDSELLIYKDEQSELAHEAPLFEIEINSFLKLRRTAKSDPTSPVVSAGATGAPAAAAAPRHACAFVVCAADQEHHLQAGTVVEMEAWIRAVTTQQSLMEVGKTKAAVMAGWLTKVRRGHVRQRWCSLLGRTLYYAKTQHSPPCGSLPLYRALVNCCPQDSDDDDDDADTLTPPAVAAAARGGLSTTSDNHSAAAAPSARTRGDTMTRRGTVVGTTTSGGRPPRPRVPDSLRARSKYFAISTARGEHFFQAPTPAEWRKWTFYLLLASGKLPDDRCTPTERVLKPLSVHKGSDLARPEFAELRDAPVLQFSKEPLGQPLTTLPDAALEQQALALSKSIHLYTSVVINQSAVTYHLRLAQDIIEQTQKATALHNEIYCQLMRMTHAHPYPNSAAAVQAWQLLVLLIPVCLPASFFLRYLGVHLRRYSHSGMPCQHLAVYGLYALRRCFDQGTRTHPPSVTEVIAVLNMDAATSRTAAQATHPLSIRVRLPSGSNYLCPIDASTTCAEVCNEVSAGLTMRNVRNSGFALFSSDPRDNNTHHAIKSGAKVCDVLYMWERKMREISVGLVETITLPFFSFQRRLYFRTNACSDEIESILLAYQVCSAIAEGKFFVQPELLPRMMSRMAQMEWGDHTTTTPDGHPDIAIAKFLPPEMRDIVSGNAPPGATSKELFERTQQRDHFLTEFHDAWRLLAGRGAKHLGVSFNDMARMWEYYGASLFAVHELSNGYRAWLCVDEEGVHVLSRDDATFVARDTMRYGDLRSFGETAGQFRLMRKIRGAVSTLAFAFEGRGAQEDCTLTIASYINAKVRKEGVTSTVAGINQVVTDHETNGPIARPLQGVYREVKRATRIPPAKHRHATATGRKPAVTLSENGVEVEASDV